MDFGIATVAAITVICYLVGQAVKASGLDNKWIPIICGIVGGILGILAMRFMADFPAQDYITQLQSALYPASRRPASTRQSSSSSSN